MKNIFFAFPILFSTVLTAQEISTHIPAKATFIVMIDPAAHVKNGDVSIIKNLDMFTRTNEYGSGGVKYVFGDDDLDVKQQESLRNFFSDIFSPSGNTGVDTARKIFIFTENADSVHYFAYLFPLKDQNSFSSYVTAKLFSTSPSIDKGSGFSAINQDRISLGWTGTYAILLLADYDYLPNTNSQYDYWRNLMLMDSVQAAQRAIADMQEQQVSADTLITDSLRTARTDSLMNESAALIEELSKDSIPEEDVNVNSMTNFPEINGEPDAHKNDTIISAYVFTELKRLINLSYEISAESIPNFRSVMAENSDAVYWYNYGEIMQQRYQATMQERRSLFMMQNLTQDTAVIANMWEGSYVASLIHFNGNDATMEQRMYFTPMLQAHTNGLYSGRVNKKMFRYVKADNLMGFMAMSVDMEKFMKFYGSVYREGIQNTMYGMYNDYYLAMWDIIRVFLDESTLYNILDGKFLVAATDLKPYTASYVSYEYDENFNMTEVRKEKTEVRPEFIFIAGIGEKKKVNQILSVLERINAVKKQNAEYYLINTPGEYDVRVFLAVKNGMLIITNNEDLMVNHLNGYRGKSSMKKSLVHLGRKSPLVGYWDGQKSIELVKKNETEDLSAEDKESLDLLAEEVNNGTLIGKRSKKGVQRIVMTMQFNESDKKDNETGFVRFFRLLNSLFLIRSN